MFHSLTVPVCGYLLLPKDDLPEKDHNMRNIILAVSAASFGMIVAIAPASALSTYEIQSDGGANFDGSPNEDAMPGGLSITSKTYNQSEQIGADGLPVNQLNSPASMQQPELSKDMSWQGTGYYLRPDR